MQFYLSKNKQPLNSSPNSVYLCYDNWNDYNFVTSFDIYYCDEHGITTKLGWLKIAKQGMDTSTPTFDMLPETFNSLDDSFYSLGQSREYYENVLALGKALGQEILIDLRDVAFDLGLFEAYIGETAMTISLLRGVNVFTVKNQFHRMALGGDALTNYFFSYTPTNISNTHGCKALSFNVIAESKPPSNIHVLIGRNGTGKTTLIQNLLYSLYSGTEQHGKFSYDEKQKNDVGRFANVVCIAFSPFDNYPDQLNIGNDTDKITMPYSYIGLNKTSADLSASIFDQFFRSFELCISNEHKKSLLLRSLDLLMTDPTFVESGIQQLIESNNCEEDEAKSLFQTLSSGHKVVLLIITCCVEKISEQTLVVIDEPENHLHPPLLSALIRALSELLINRNGVAIVSTHSPVVLQEVPSNCVWMLRRVRDKLIAERPQLQSFGAGVSTLTNEVFGLEVNKSGFHRLLVEAAQNSPDYAHALAEFDGHLGDEAKILLRSMIFTQKDTLAND